MDFQITVTIRTPEGSIEGASNPMAIGRAAAIAGRQLDTQTREGKHREHKEAFDTLQDFLLGIHQTHLANQIENPPQLDLSINLLATDIAEALIGEHVERINDNIFTELKIAIFGLIDDINNDSELVAQFIKYYMSAYNLKVKIQGVMELEDFYRDPNGDIEIEMLRDLYEEVDRCIDLFNDDHLKVQLKEILTIENSFVNGRYLQRVLKEIASSSAFIEKVEMHDLLKICINLVSILECAISSSAQPLQTSFEDQPPRPSCCTVS